MHCFNVQTIKIDCQCGIFSSSSSECFNWVTRECQADSQKHDCSLGTRVHGVHLVDWFVVVNELYAPKPGQTSSTFAIHIRKNRLDVRLSGRTKFQVLDRFSAIAVAAWNNAFLSWKSQSCADRPSEVTRRSATYTASSASPGQRYIHTCRCSTRVVTKSNDASTVGHSGWFLPTTCQS